MSDFRVHQFQLAARHYILLPKLNGAQVKVLHERLVEKGFAPDSSHKGVRGETEVVHVDPEGLCWANFDPSDAVLPALPEILSMSKEKIPLGGLLRKYFGQQKEGSDLLVRLSTRLESSSTWGELRRLGQSALAPDERSVACFLIAVSKGPLEMVTNYPTEGSRQKIHGRRLYYESFLEPEEAARNLSSLGRKGPRDSFLPRNGILRLRSYRSPPRKSWVGLFDSLEDWCYLRPTWGKSSNWQN